MPVAGPEARAGAGSFLAVVPPDPIVDDIVDLRRSIGLDTAVLPHVTVKAQPNLESPALWRPAVHGALATIPPFDLALGDVGWFGDGVVFLDVGDEVVGLHRIVLDAVESVAQGDRFEYEGDAYTPHLTLGAGFLGDTNDELGRIADAVARTRWPSFRVSEVVELRRERPDQPCVPVAAHALGIPGT